MYWGYENITVDGDFDTQKFYRLRKGCFNEQSRTSIIRNGVEAFYSEQIERVFKEEFEERLSIPQPDSDTLKEIINKSNLSFQLLIDGIY